MPRIAGVDIPTNKRIEFALRYIHGIGPKVAMEVLKEAQVEVAKTFDEKKQELDLSEF